MNAEYGNDKNRRMNHPLIRWPVECWINYSRKTRWYWREVEKWRWTTIPDTKHPPWVSFSFSSHFLILSWPWHIMLFPLTIPLVIVCILIPDLSNEGERSTLHDRISICYARRSHSIQQGWTDTVDSWDCIRGKNLIFWLWTWNLMIVESNDYSRQNNVIFSKLNLILPTL